MMITIAVRMMKCMRSMITVMTMTTAMPTMAMPMMMIYSKWPWSVPKRHVGDDMIMIMITMSWQKPPNAISWSIPKRHVGHLNDLVAVCRGKPFRVKSFHKKGGDVVIDYCLWYQRSSTSRGHYNHGWWMKNLHNFIGYQYHLQGSVQKAGSWCKLQTAARTPVPWGEGQSLGH